VISPPTSKDTFDKISAEPDETLNGAELFGKPSSIDTDWVDKYVDMLSRSEPVVICGRGDESVIVCPFRLEAK
jgi:hypothetical protein